MSLNGETIKEDLVLQKQDITHPDSMITVFYGLVEACQDAWAEQSETGTVSRAFSGILYSDLLRAAVQLEEFEFFEEAAKNRNMTENVPLAFFTWLRQWVGCEHNESASRMNQIRAGLRHCLPSFFEDRFAAIQAFAPLEGSGRKCAAISQFAERELTSGVYDSNPSHLCRSDGLAMVKSARYFDDARFFISECVAQRIFTCYNDPEVVFGFLFQIQQDGIQGIPQEDAAIICHSIAADFLSRATPEEWRSRPAIEALFKKGSPEERSAVNGEHIAEFLSAFLEANPEDEELVLDFLANLIETLPGLHARELPGLWIPFLAALTHILASNDIPFTEPVCQNLYSTFITKLVDEFVGHEPPEVSDYVRPGVSGGCYYCVEVNAFLV
ncbi:unnamed protein product [Clonostachys rosea]|uniref:Uncharacterized protein n=1 Tax=Bionectria ochroleuca TaxID=29856 RepID=A0ABY6U503_BIOOC|nr:unnamed protein product [Clonostachys rosea]